MIEARVRITHDGNDLGVSTPGISSFPNFNGGIGTPSIHTTLVRDLYLTLESTPNQRGRVTIGIAVKPMIVWLWIGGAVVALGTLLALTPSLRRKRKRGEPVVETPAVEHPDFESVLT